MALLLLQIYICSRKLFFLNPCFKFSKHLMLLFIDIVTAIHSLVLFIRNYTLPADLAGWFGSATAVAFNISDITKFLNYDKSSCIWQLIKGKLGESQTLLKSFNGIATFLYNMLSADGVLPIASVLPFTSLHKKITFFVFSLFILQSFQFN